MDTPLAREVDIVKLLDIVQDLLAHALTLQQMYQENLEPEEYARLRAGNELLARQNCAPVRASLHAPDSFEAAVNAFAQMDPKHRPH